MAIKKKTFSLEDIKGKFSTKTKYKPESFYNCGEAFMDTVGLPGPVMGGINMFLGHSNTSKSTAMILAAVDAQKKRTFTCVYHYGEKMVLGTLGRTWITSGTK